MTKIKDLESGKAWREHWRAAAFRGARFHVDVGSKESGRRIVSHEFPKRDVPYAEDMGRRQREFTVRGYIIVYPSWGRNTKGNSGPLQQANYLTARDELIKALETAGPAELQLPLLGALKVACSRYRVTEEKKYGGFCVFDMSFVEYGQAPGQGSRDSKTGVEAAAAATGDATKASVSSGIRAVGSGAVQ